MIYYERKAQQIRDHCLVHPWTEDAQCALEDMLKEIAKDQRHACAESLGGTRFRDEAYLRIQNAEIEE